MGPGVPWVPGPKGPIQDFCNTSSKFWDILLFWVMLNNFQKKIFEKSCLAMEYTRFIFKAKSNRLRWDSNPRPLDSNPGIFRIILKNRYNLNRLTFQASIPSPRTPASPLTFHEEHFSRWREILKKFSFKVMTIFLNNIEKPDSVLLEKWP